MSRSPKTGAKQKVLKKQGSLHPHPNSVTDKLFLEKEFFDPRDLVQVKYEMLRRVRIDGHPVQSTARAFGLSRPTFYQAQQAYERDGVMGLVPSKKGPRRAHKLSEKVLGFIHQQLQADDTLKAPELAQRIHERFAVTIHPRTIQRALARRQKKTN
jgi:transposase